MATMQNIIDRVRFRLNDAQKVRNPDTQVLQYLNDMVKAAYNFRPDFFIGQYTAPPFDLASGGTYPLPGFSEPAAVEYCVALCNLPDDEEARQAKARDAEARFFAHLYGPK